MGRNCNKCEESLVLGDNWSSSRKKKNHYICNPCFNRIFKERKAYKEARTTTRKNLKVGRKLSLKITNFIQDSIKRNKEFELEREFIANLMTDKCFYCGSDEDHNGIDRVDSSIGYLKDNVVTCCPRCNYGKHTMTTNEFLDHCKKVVLHMEV